jgi:hypothetical protein
LIVNHNKGGVRQKIEINLKTLNGNTFRGLVTRKEGKHLIYRDSLGFEDFINFGGIRFGYKDRPVAIFKLKTAINVDELLLLINSLISGVQ